MPRMPASFLAGHQPTPQSKKQSPEPRQRAWLAAGDARREERLADR